MASQAAISGNATKNNGGTIKKAGSYVSTGPITNSRSLRDDALYDGYGAKVVEATSPTSSGNLGTYKALSNFAHPMNRDTVIAKKLGAYINNTASTLLGTCAADTGKYQNPASITTTRVLGSGVNTTWDYETGVITKGASAGQTANFGSDYAAGSGDTVPGYITYNTGAALPTSDVYKPRTG